MKPLVKWAGGKAWFVRQAGVAIAEHLLETGKRFIDPFVGGAALPLYLGSEKVPITIGDTNEDLIKLYVAVRDAPHDLIKQFQELWSMGTDKETYLAVRALDLEEEEWVESAARLLYLNRLCYNGLYRVNKKGEFNVPYGDGKGSPPSKEAILSAHRSLEEAVITLGDFEDLIDEAGDGDFVYCDPPYYLTFSDYAATGFGRQDHERLAKSLERAHKRGAEILAHNADEGAVRDWYGPWAELEESTEKRSVGAANRDRAGCLLISAAVS